MKTTATIYDLIKLELIKEGKNEFFVGGQLVLADDNDHNFIKKIMRYDDDVKKIVNNKFFNGITLIEETHDDHFKKMFINRFMNREISKQTLEDFASQVTFLFLANEDYLNFLYENMEKLLSGTSETETDDTTTSITDNRDAYAQLPQNTVNINVDDTVLDYADDNRISRQKHENVGGGKSENRQYSFDGLNELEGRLQRLMNEFEKKCFLLVW